MALAGKWGSDARKRQLSLKGWLLHRSSWGRLELNPNDKSREIYKHMPQNYQSWDVMELAKWCAKSRQFLVTDVCRRMFSVLLASSASRQLALYSSDTRALSQMVHASRRESGPESIHALRDTCGALAHPVTPSRQGDKIWAADAENAEKEVMLVLTHEGWILMRRKLGGVGGCLSCAWIKAQTQSTDMSCYSRSDVPRCQHFSVLLEKVLGGPLQGLMDGITRFFFI